MFRNVYQVSNIYKKLKVILLSAGESSEKATSKQDSVKVKEVKKPRKKFDFGGVQSMLFALLIGKRTPLLI